MRCTNCGGMTKVVDSRNSSYKRKYRRRLCLECGKRFSTWEVVAKEAEKLQALRVIIQRLIQELPEVGDG